MKLRLRIIAEYDANPEHYGTDDPVKMAEIDISNLSNNPEDIASFLERNGYHIIIDAPHSGYVKGFNDGTP